MGYVLDGGGPKDSENTLNSFLTKRDGNMFWQIGADMMYRCLLVPDLCPFERMIVYGINVCSPLLSSNKAIIEKWEHVALFAPGQCDFKVMKFKLNGENNNVVVWP